MQELTEEQIDAAAWERRVEWMKTYRKHSNVCFAYHWGGQDCDCGYLEMLRREKEGV